MVRITVFVSDSFGSSIGLYVVTPCRSGASADKSSHSKAQLLAAGRPVGIGSPATKDTSVGSVAGSCYVRPQHWHRRTRPNRVWTGIGRCCCCCCCWPHVSLVISLSSIDRNITASSALSCLISALYRTAAACRHTVRNGSGAAGEGAS